MSYGARARSLGVVLSAVLTAAAFGAVVQPTAFAAPARRAKAHPAAAAAAVAPAGTITTVAGIGTPFSTGDNLPAISAEIDAPDSVAIDHSGNRVIGDCGSRVHVVAESSGTFYGQSMTARRIDTIAGTGVAGYSGDGGSGAAAQISACPHVGADAAGNVLIADTGNNRVRVVAGTSATFYGIAMTVGDIYTIGGNGTHGSSGDGLAATQAQVVPESVSVDGSGNVLLTDNTVPSPRPRHRREHRDLLRPGDDRRAHLHRRRQRRCLPGRARRRRHRHRRSALLGHERLDRLVGQPADRRQRQQPRPRRRREHGRVLRPVDDRGRHLHDRRQRDPRLRG